MCVTGTVCVRFFSTLPWYLMLHTFTYCTKHKVTSLWTPSTNHLLLTATTVPRGRKTNCCTHDMQVCINLTFLELDASVGAWGKHLPIHQRSSSNPCSCTDEALLVYSPALALWHGFLSLAPYWLINSFLSVKDITTHLNCMYACMQYPRVLFNILYSFNIQAYLHNIQKFNWTPPAVASLLHAPWHVQHLHCSVSWTRSGRDTVTPHLDAHTVWVH